MMEHKAFIFDYGQFDRELLSILEDALATNDCSAVIAFIRRNIESITDPTKESRWQKIGRT